MEQLCALAPAEHMAKLAKPPPGEPVAVRQPHVPGVQSLAQRDDARAIVWIALVVVAGAGPRGAGIVWIALVVLAVAVQRGAVRGRVDVVSWTADGRHSAGDQRLPQALRR